MKARPFSALRPTPEAAPAFASLPYDVFDDSEARSYVEQHPDSFLAIDRSETAFEVGHDMYADEVYEKAREIFEARIADGTLIQDDIPSYYIYRQIRDGHAQTGIVALCSIDEYENGAIKRHELVRPEKMQDRISHIKALNAQTGPIFMAYRDNSLLASIIERVCSENPLIDFVGEDGIQETVWRVFSPLMVVAIESAFESIPATYIADGHHRAASAVQVGLDARAASKDDQPLESDWFMSVLFPGSELVCLPYNRVVHDTNGLCSPELLDAIKKAGFSVEAIPGAFDPDRKGCFGMYLMGSWYRLTAGESLIGADPVSSLDASILQDHLLEPIIGIKDPTKDSRIEFVGGVRGTAELEQRAGEEGVAFSLYGTTMEQVMAVADADLLMPPKSTWFEPKLKSGLFIHCL